MALGMVSQLPEGYMTSMSRRQLMAQSILNVLAPSHHLPHIGMALGMVSHCQKRT